MLAVEWVPVAVAAVAVAAAAVAAAVAAVAVVSWQRDQSPRIPRGGGGDGDDCCCCCGHDHGRCHCWCHSFLTLTPSYKITTTYCVYSTMTGWLTVSVGTVLVRSLHVYFVHPQTTSKNNK